MFRTLFPCCLSLVLAATATGQSVADWWYFGNKAGIHFTASGPVADTNGQLNTFEGCASISDAQGNLLFYTDGATVYDATHSAMPNGTGLMGHSSSTQSAVVVPKPSSAGFYYVFTIPDIGSISNGFRYSLVDMSLNGGLGDVVASEKNVFLADTASERLTVVTKSDGYWVITLNKTNGDTTLLAFEVTAAGVNTTPVVTEVGGVNPSTYGYMRTNSQNTKLVVVSGSIVAAYDINLTTGELFNPLIITTSFGVGLGYGVEFSPNGEILYVCSFSTCDIRQFDLTQGTAAGISASEQSLGSLGVGGGALQLGPDGKIYCARMNRTFISVINNPDVLGSGCGFQDTALLLDGRISTYGLPTFTPWFSEIQIQLGCFGDTAFFEVNGSLIDSVKWNFGDPASGTFNTSTQLQAAHFFSDTGEFTVTVVVYSANLSRTITRTVHVYARAQSNFPSDTTICWNSPVTLTLRPNPDNASFLWSSGSTADSALVSSDTVIWVTVFGGCDTISDTLRVEYAPIVSVDLGPDLAFCGDSTIVKHITTFEKSVHQWRDGSTADSATITGDTLIWVTIAGGCNTVSDTLNVNFAQPIVFDLGADTVTCASQKLAFSVPRQSITSYLWSDSTTTETTFSVDTTATVWVSAVNPCGSFSDTVRVTFAGGLPTSIGSDTLICDRDSIALDATATNATYLWSTGDTTATIYTLVEKGSTDYAVTVTRSGCTSKADIRITLSDLFCESIQCGVEVMNVFTPNNDGVNDIWLIESDCDIHTYELKIFNRWGMLVHYSTKVAMGWDGYANDAPAPEGVYYYMMKFRDSVVIDVDHQEFQGSLTLMR